ncbi:MAG: efflux RND transporter periplasmic adaptor subunit [Planctomycetota bacterium]|jgi:membrane fusion protein (multidrug efflux system)
MTDEKQKKAAPSKGRGKLRRLVIKAIIVLAAVGVLVGIAWMPKPNRQTKPSEVPAVNVKVMQVVAQPDFADAFELPAVIEPNRVVTISAEVESRVERIPPQEGDRVQVGDLLVRLNDELIRPLFDVAKAQHERNQIEFERMEMLVKENATSQRDLDNARTQLAASAARLAEIQARLNRTEIYTPLAGVLNDLPIEEGEYVQAGTPVAEVVDTDVVKVVVDVPERDVVFFTVGQEADVLLEMKGQAQSIRGTITYINELANQQTRSTSMEITLDNRAGRLRSGQIVRVRLTRRTLNGAILIPLLAVIPLEAGYAVYVIDEAAQAQRRVVELGMITGDRVLVTSGLEPGMMLIIDGHRLVAPGQKVNMVAENQ